jgi:hypothetical protein
VTWGLAHIGRAIAVVLHSPASSRYFARPLITRSVPPVSELRTWMHW